jgi:hypothetical protein
MKPGLTKKYEDAHPLHSSLEGIKGWVTLWPSSGNGIFGKPLQSLYKHQSGFAEGTAITLDPLDGSLPGEQQDIVISYCYALTCPKPVESIETHAGGADVYGRSEMDFAVRIVAQMEPHRIQGNGSRPLSLFFPVLNGHVMVLSRSLPTPSLQTEFQKARKESN